jgi:hypothetical protein
MKTITATVTYHRTVEVEVEVEDDATGQEIENALLSEGDELMALDTKNLTTEPGVISDVQVDGVSVFHAITLMVGLPVD